MNQMLMIVMAAGAVLGGLDRIFGNKLGLGEQFEKGFMLLGPMALSMAGMICLAPVLADVLGRAVVPFFQLIGVDPAMFGSLLAIDMGGYQLAKELAVDGRVGSYAGLVVSAIFGCTVVFTIPVGMGMISPGDRPLFARGIMLGLTAMPVGLIAGGLLSGLSLTGCLHQNLPIFALALLLLLGLWKVPEQMVKGFCLLAEGIKTVITIGLVLAAVESLTGWNPAPGMASIGEAMGVVASIGVVMLGSLPAAELLATPLPALAAYQDMDERGKVAAGAFLVSGASLLAAHMGFVIGTEPDMLAPLAAGKLSGAVAAAALALWTQRNRQ